MIKPDMKKTEKRNGVTALDRAVFHLVEKYAFEVCLIVILGISLYARIVMIPNCVLSSDYNNFIVPWVNKYRELGIVNGLAAKVGDYYVPYNVLLAIIAQLPFEPYLSISVVHVTAEYLGAYFLFKTITLVLDEKQGKTVSATAHRRNRKMAAVIAAGTLFLPSVLMNASLWKQCDSLYTCAMIISLYLVLSRRYTAGFLIYAFGLCLKLQAVFFLPFLVILYLSRKDFSIFEFFWIPFMYVLTGLPAVICGRRFQDVYKTYLRATGEYDGMEFIALLCVAAYAAYTVQGVRKLSGQQYD